MHPVFTHSRSMRVKLKVARPSFVALLVGLSFTCASTISLAAANQLPIHCRPCTSVADSILMIGSPSDDERARTMTRLWIEKHVVAAEQEQANRTGKPVRVVTRYPLSIAELRSEVQQLADQCVRIVSLGMMSHGNLGYFEIGADGVSVQNVEDAFGHGFGCAMAADASVHIGGCNVGRSCRGASFMLSAARLLLPKGGRMVAPESYVYGNAIFGIAPRSLFRERELKVEVGASHPQWLHGDQLGPDCEAFSQSTH